MKRTRWLFVVALVAWSAPSLADDAKKLASERFRAGEQAFAKGAFGVAAREFERADELVPHPSTTMNAAEAWERAGDLERAATLAERVTETATGDVRIAADALLARVVTKLSTVEVIGPSSARVQIGGRDVSPPSKLHLKPGTYVVTMRGAAGDVREERVELAAGASKTLDATTPSAAPRPATHTDAPASAQAPAAATSPVEPAPPSRGVPALAWGSFGLAAAGVGAFAFFGTRTLSAQRTYEASPTATNRDAFYESRTLSNVSLAAAGVFAVTGVVLVLSSRSDTRTGQRRDLTLSANAGGATLGGRF